MRHALPVRIDSTPDGIRHDKVDALYTSPSRRAVETVAPLAAALSRQPIPEPGIAEFDAADPSYVPVEELKASGDPRWHRLVAGDLYTVGVDPAQCRTRASWRPSSGSPRSIPVVGPCS